MSLKRISLLINLPHNKGTMAMKSLSVCRKPDVPRKDLIELLGEENIAGIAEEDLADYSNGDTVMFGKDDSFKESSFFPQITESGNVIGTDPETGNLLLEQGPEKKSIPSDSIVPLSAIKKIVRGSRGNAIVALSKKMASIEHVLEIVSLILLTATGACILFRQFYATAAVGIAYVICAYRTIGYQQDIELLGKKFTTYLSFRSSAIGIGAIPPIGEDDETKGTIVDVYVELWTKLGEAACGEKALAQ